MNEPSANQGDDVHKTTPKEPIAKQNPEAAARIALMQADNITAAESQVSDIAKIMGFCLLIACVKVLYQFVEIVSERAFGTAEGTIFGTFMERNGIASMTVVVLFALTLVVLLKSKSSTLIMSLLALSAAGILAWLFYDVTNFAAISVLFDLLLVYELYRVSREL